MQRNFKTPLQSLAIITTLSVPLFSFDFQSHIKGIWGVGGSVLQSNYENEDTQITLSPYIFGSIGSLQIEANRLLYPLYATPDYTLLATGNYRSQQYSELYNKDRSVELGLTLDVLLSQGFRTRLVVLGDITGTYEGYEPEAQVYRHDTLDKFNILTALSLQYQDKNLANYYYSSTDYTADEGYVFEAEMIATYPIGDFALFTGVRSYWYGNNVSDSPIVSSSNTLLGFFGVGYRF